MNPTKPYVIVAAIDYSKFGDLALERAFELATEKRHAEVHIIYVLQSFGALGPVELGVGASGPDASVLERASEELRTYADRKLQEFKASQSGKTQLFDRAVSHLRVESPAHEIAQLASDLEADLVVVGTHGRRGATRLLVGSVAEGVVRLAPCPVLVVRPRDRDADEGVPKIEPPCPHCVETRRRTAGQEMWCATHRERHGRRHTYHMTDRVGSETNFPLVTPER
jgi:nucleotide-binding universal stress UspA family protein